MPRVAGRQLLALAAVARSPAESAALLALSAQPAATLWSLATAQTSCGRSCTCSRCVASVRSHHLGCGCSRCQGGMGAVPLGSSATAGRSCFATLNDSQSQLDAINDRFSEAREEISIAHDDAETTYFDEAYQDAKKATTEVLQMFNDLLDSLDEAERGKLQRSMGMKMEQLKAEMSQLDMHD